MIFGSTAIKHFYPEFRTPNDLDIMTRDVGVTKEVQKYWIDEFQDLIDLSNNREYLDPNLCLTNKCAHANWNIHWEKTMADILFLKNKGHKINKPIYNKLVKAWRKVHGRESAPLKGKTQDQFFGDAVKRVYNHDSIHDAIAFYDEPIFKRTLKKDGEVDCSESAFNKLAHEDQLKMAKEEIYVTALERFFIPNNMDYSKGRAYNASLKKFVTTMSSGWMSFFLIDNFKDLLYNGFDYVKKFEENKYKLIKL